MSLLLLAGIVSAWKHFSQLTQEPGAVASQLTVIGARIKRLPRQVKPLSRPKVPSPRARDDLASDRTIMLVFRPLAGTRKAR
jgi:hypothetical protein